MLHLRRTSVAQKALAVLETARDRKCWTFLPCKQSARPFLDRSKADPIFSAKTELTFYDAINCSKIVVSLPLTAL